VWTCKIHESSADDGKAGLNKFYSYMRAKSLLTDVNLCSQEWVPSLKSCSCWRWCFAIATWWRSAVGIHTPAQLHGVPVMNVLLQKLRGALFGNWNWWLKLNFYSHIAMNLHRGFNFMYYPVNSNSYCNH
jgi:hypothetical protein